LDLPVWFQRGVKKKGDAQLKGRLRIKNVLVPFLEEQDLNLPLDARMNSLSIPSPTTLRIEGGKVRFGPVSARRILDPDLTVETSLTLGAFELDPLLSPIWSSPVKGTLRGQLNPVRFEGGLIETRGELKADLFGGEVVISNVGADGILTSAPLIRTDVQWRDLLLSEMTTGTSFGRIEGVLQGHAEGLEIAYGQPQKFQLLMETEKRKGVSQKISVKAVDNIAQIGGGQSPFIGMAGVLTSFFKEFPYEKIGVRASLENDMFTINGTIQEGGLEYLVKRSGFSGVNVVNQNPDNRISFKDMVKRVKRITGSKSGPVVK
jgi:hypothetical protein